MLYLENPENLLTFLQGSSSSSGKHWKVMSVLVLTQPDVFPCHRDCKKINPLEKATPTTHSFGPEHLESGCTCGRSNWILEPAARPGRTLHAPSTRSCCFSTELRTPRPRKGQGLTRGNRPPAAGLSLLATATPGEAGEGRDGRQKPRVAGCCCLQMPACRGATVAVVPSLMSSLA